MVFFFAGTPALKSRFRGTGQNPAFKKRAFCGSFLFSAIGATLSLLAFLAVIIHFRSEE